MDGKDKMTPKKVRLRAHFGQRRFWRLDKNIARLLGPYAAQLLAHFLEIYLNYENIPDQFYQQKDRIREELNWSERDLDNAIKKLREAGMLQVERKGMPPKNYYTLLEGRIIEAADSE